MYQFFVLMMTAAAALVAEGHTQEYQDLDALAVQAHADKSSEYHNYTEVYARYFAPLRDKPIKFLEIGIYKGNSVKLWEEYFSAAELHFIDITLENVEYSSSRAHYHIANQEDPRHLQQFIAASGGNFDIIIDDGGHMMSQQITSFKELFPHVKSGGLYIIEDLHTSYWLQFGGGVHRRGTAVEFLKGLIDEINYVGYRTARASHRNVDPEILKTMDFKDTIESMCFYDSLVVIKKR